MFSARLLAFLCSPNRKAQDFIGRCPGIYNMDFDYQTLDHYDFYYYNINIILL